jgi:prophage regulatory protein
MTMLKSRRLTRSSSVPSPSLPHRSAVLTPEMDMTYVPRDPIRILRLPQVLQLTGLGKTTVYELQSRGTFPMRVKLTNHCVGWIAQDVQSWLEYRVSFNAPRQAK